MFEIQNAWSTYVPWSSIILHSVWTRREYPPQMEQDGTNGRYAPLTSLRLDLRWRRSIRWTLVFHRWHLFVGYVMTWRKLSMQFGIPLEFFRKTTAVPRSVTASTTAIISHWTGLQSTPVDFTLKSQSWVNGWRLQCINLYDDVRLSFGLCLML